MDRSDDSGIEGRVIIRPIRPVERPGMDNWRPYQARITVLDQQGRVVTALHSGADGFFRVCLEPGTYVLSPESDQSRHWSRKQTVTVPERTLITVDIAFDSGIR